MNRDLLDRGNWMSLFANIKQERCSRPSECRSLLDNAKEVIDAAFVTFENRPSNADLFENLSYRPVEKCAWMVPVKGLEENGRIDGEKTFR